ncbi:unnamed protein product [Zymoseptoria tritici ST99CH_3D7]|uniref:FAD-binding FR-type domain-containing protein n=1 Tax=Zymoseptoria tritici (strain ST99CH_3D7) TaxID=1276538 RepID=A0A1X7RF42_ZYMT9|nr:unnamed protein product [Zymoseptoria tritici ST99CH_3D7]
MAFFQALPWHKGEETLHALLSIPSQDNPTVPALSPQLSHHLPVVPLIALGTLDSRSRPWTTLLGGQKGLSQPLGGGILGIRTAVPGKWDPVVEELVGKEGKGDVVREEGEGRMVSGLTIDLETRKRTKFFGRMVAGALSREKEEGEGEVAGMQLVLKVEQSLGNCPKYLNSKAVSPAVSRPELVLPAGSSEPTSYIPDEAVDLLAGADLFFVSSSQHALDMDTNHRGGPPGFLRLASNSPSCSDAAGAVLVWPEYSGNRLYQTLGNLSVNPVAGLCIPDFETGNMLYLTGKTEILVGKDASSVLPGTRLAVKLTVTECRFVKSTLTFRGTEGKRSPYNPVVRHLASEKPTTLPSSTSEIELTARLLSQTVFTPTISRFRFKLHSRSGEELPVHRPGQYVTMDFSKDLDVGYSHMRDDDPRSLNEDWVRTFTVSSAPASSLPKDEFEMTIRKVGVVTEFLFKHDGESVRSRGELEVKVLDFGGEFEVEQKDEEVVAFVAAGVGITPLLPSLNKLDLERLEVLWTVREADLGLVRDVLDKKPELSKAVKLFVTTGGGVDEKKQEDSAEKGIAKIELTGAEVYRRRMTKEDVDLLGNHSNAKRHFLCMPLPMRKLVEEWVGHRDGKEVIFEDFNF